MIPKQAWRCALQSASSSKLCRNSAKCTFSSFVSQNDNILEYCNDIEAGGDITDIVHNFRRKKSAVRYLPLKVDDVNVLQI